MDPERTGSERCWSAGWDGREFWTSRPPYVELHRNARRTVVIQGVLRHDGAPLSAAKVLASPGLELEPKQVTGNGTIVVIDRADRRLWAYRTMLGTAEVYWWSHQGRLLCADNLGAMAALLPEPRACEQALPLHFIYRSVPGRLTYLRDVHRLGPGELLTWQDGSVDIRLRRDLRALAPQRQVGIDRDSIRTFLATLASTIADYERAAAQRGTGAAILLSGGVDSSLMVLAAAASGRKPVALTTITKRSAELEREIAYARQAAERLQAEHRFVEAGRMDDAEALIETIKVLGQPPHHESTVNGLVGARELARQEAGLGRLLHGQGADALHGLNVAARIQYAERCPAWSVAVLRLAANMLGHVVPTKAAGAHAAAAMLGALRTPDSPLHPANQQAAYTDWAATEQAFGGQTVRGDGLPPRVGGALRRRANADRAGADDRPLQRRVGHRLPHAPDRALAAPRDRVPVPGRGGGLGVARVRPAYAFRRWPADQAGAQGGARIGDVARFRRSPEAVGRLSLDPFRGDAVGV